MKILQIKSFLCFDIKINKNHIGLERLDKHFNIFNYNNMYKYCVDLDFVLTADYHQHNGY